MQPKRKAVVLLSGGLDSATCMALAKQQGYECYALSFDYGQRHIGELAAAANIATLMQVAMHRIIKMDLGGIGGSALTDASLTIPEQESVGIPITYVPARNSIFLAFALAWAEVLQAQAIFIGVNALDYSGYPDCRPAFIEAFQHMANLATKAGVEGNALKIEAPLLAMDKAGIIKAGIAAGVDYALTVSCYQLNDKNEACGRCDSCRFRRKGFLEAAVTDPTRYVTY
ncbi:MAG: 7-cyano-7-deazaguanine synthase QueC [Gammaproteobacteria bacterium]